MIIDIKVITGAKKNLIKEEESGLKVYVNCPPVDGKANKAVMEMLADFYGVKKNCVEIIKGLKSRKKTISISGKKFI